MDEWTTSIMNTNDSYQTANMQVTENFNYNSIKKGNWVNYR